MAWRGNTENKVPNNIQFDTNRSEERLIENRASQVRRDTDQFKNFTIGIKNIDDTVLIHLEKMQLSVVDSGNVIKVPVNYASPEKWKSIKKDGYMRDNNGKLILPALVFYRTGIEEDKTFKTFNKYLKYNVMQKYSVKNQYTRSKILLSGKNSPVNEIYSVVMPDHMNFEYKFIIWTEYIEQMNSIIERINFETNDYWGLEHGFRFRTTVDSYANTVELQSDNDRVIKTEFNLLLRGYLLPDQYAPALDGFRPTTQKVFTPKKVIIGTEVVKTGWELKQDESVANNWKNKNYPNIVEGTEPKPPGIHFKETITESSGSI